MNTRSDWIGITVSAILLPIVTIIVMEIFRIYVPFQNVTPKELGNLLDILSFIIPYLLIVALLNKANNLKDTISKGAMIGIFSGFVLFVFYALYFEIQKSSNPGELDEGSYSIIGMLSLMFTLFFIISSIVGLILSYFIRKKKNKSSN